MIEKFILESLGVLHGAAVRVTIVEWKTLRGLKSVHKALHVGKRSVALRRSVYEWECW